VALPTLEQPYVRLPDGIMPGRRSEVYRRNLPPTGLPHRSDRCRRRGAATAVFACCWLQKVSTQGLFKRATYKGRVDHTGGLKPLRVDLLPLYIVAMAGGHGYVRMCTCVVFLWPTRRTRLASVLMRALAHSSMETGCSPRLHRAESWCDGVCWESET
jgi:hypothetical protein